MMFSLLVNMKIASRGLTSKYAKAYQLRTIDLGHPSLQKM